VVEEAADFNAIDRDLRRIDARLFLTYEIDSRSKRRVYRVLCEFAGDKPPGVLCEWRDGWGYPLPLSSGLLTQVQKQRGELVDFEALNAAKVEREIADFEAEVDEAVADMGPRIAGKRSPAFHRGIHLRRSREGR
jgi:hypothetical protein